MIQEIIVGSMTKAVTQYIKLYPLGGTREPWKSLSATSFISCNNYRNSTAMQLTHF